MNTLAIATHLNVLETAIVRIEEWASVIFVVAKGVGARFVSKKINVEEVEMNTKNPMFAVHEAIKSDHEKVKGFALGDRQYRGAFDDVMKINQGDCVLLKSALKQDGLEMALLVSLSGIEAYN